MADRIRQAATIVATRRGTEGPEVLVVERSAESRFLPGYVAFPGGAVDPDDEEHAARWFGSPAEAARAAAVRELLAETGIAVTGAGAGAAATAGLAAVDADPPAAASMREIAHWVAPEDVPVRFDARYFAVELPLGVDPVPDGGETADAWWISPRALLDGWHAGTQKLYWPTWLTVSELAGCTSVEALLALRLEPREPDDDEVASMPRSVFWDR